MRAHNLLERGREMYSAALFKGRFPQNEEISQEGAPAGEAAGEMQ